MMILGLFFAVQGDFFSCSIAGSPIGNFPTGDNEATAFDLQVETITVARQELTRNVFLLGGMGRSVAGRVPEFQVESALRTSRFAFSVDDEILKFPTPNKEGGK